MPAGGDARQTLVIAHRGAWGEGVAENTLEAFERAFELGADMVELDVRRTADGRLIAHHDADVGGIPVADLRYGELTLAGGRSRPPLLVEVFQRLGASVALDLELKQRGCVEQLVALLRRVGAGRCLISSFLDDVVRDAKALAPGLPAALLVAGSAAGAPDRARRCHADRIALEAGLAAPATLAAAAAAGFPCLVWTVNDVPGIDRFLCEPAVVGVVTDRPGLALERRDALSG